MSRLDTWLAHQMNTVPRKTSRDLLTAPFSYTKAKKISRDLLKTERTNKIRSFCCDVPNDVSSSSGKKAVICRIPDFWKMDRMQTFYRSGYQHMNIHQRQQKTLLAATQISLHLLFSSVSSCASETFQK